MSMTPVTKAGWIGLISTMVLFSGAVVQSATADNALGQGTPFADGVGGTWATATQSGSTYTALKPTNKNDWNFGPMSPLAPWRQITDATTTSGSTALSTTHAEFSASDVGMLIDDAHGSGVIASGTTITAFGSAAFMARMNRSAFSA